VRSVIHTADAGVDSYLRKISEEQVKVDNLARLVDAQCRFHIQITAQGSGLIISKFVETCTMDWRI
jgi:hypothetical protein